MRWIFIGLFSIAFLGLTSLAANADQPKWELICEEGFGGMALACAVRKPAIMVYADTSGRRDITLGFEHHLSRTSGQLEGLLGFRFQIDGGGWDGWRLGYESRAEFDATVARIMDAKVIISRHAHFTSRVEFSETASIDQGFRDAYAELERQIAAASVR